MSCNVFYDVESIADMIGKLTEIWTGLSDNPPYELYRQVCQALAVLHYNESDNWKSAFYLTESQAITFTHKSHLALAQRSRYVGHCYNIIII